MFSYFEFETSKEENRERERGERGACKFLLLNSLFFHECCSFHTKMLILDINLYIYIYEVNMPFMANNQKKQRIIFQP